jgi:Protein kinase domain
VAIKVLLNGSHADAEELTRFRSEAEIIAKLNHPNIVSIFDFGECDGRPYLSIEYIDGGSLADKLHKTSTNSMLPREATKLIAMLARAVQHAHEQGILHRDLKPANILMTRDGVPRIVDFGLARRIGLEGPTRSSAILGTPSYMAPEQAIGQGLEVTWATDVYSLGAILYECLTTTPPFFAATALETLDQVRNEEAVPLRKRNRTIPRDLETICLRTLEKSPDRRNHFFPNAKALAAHLENYLEGKPCTIRPVSWAESAWKYCKREPLRAALGFLTAMIVVGVWAGYSISSKLTSRLRTSDDVALSRQSAARSMEERYRNPALALLSAWYAFHKANTLEARDCLFKTLRDRPGLEAILGIPEGSTSVVQYSPDGKYIATGFGSLPDNKTGGVILWNAATKQRMPTLFIDVPYGSVQQLAFTPDSKTLAILYGRHDRLNSGILLWNVAKNEHIFGPFSPKEESHGRVDASRDPFDVQETDDLSRLTVTSNAFSPDGKTLAIGCSDINDLNHSVLLWDVMTRNKTPGPVLRVEKGSIESLAFSNDGSRLAAGCGVPGKLQGGVYIRAIARYWVI